MWLPIVDVMTEAAPAPWPGPGAARYVALGDSYSAGLGTGRYATAEATCGRSPLGYPSLIAAGHRLDLVLRACSGATIADVHDLQLPALDEGTRYVTITVGGNDAGFARVLSECALPAWASDAHAAIDTAQRYITGPMAGELTTLYEEIRHRAPVAIVVVAGYPRLFSDQDCNALTWFSPTELRRLNDTADLLNHVIGQAARAAQLTFANPTEAFIGHAVCQDEWINGLSYPIEESYHPNDEGQALGYAPLVAPLLVEEPLATAPPDRLAEVSTRIEAQCRTHAQLDSAIVPRPIIPPDLHRPDVVVAATRAGVDVDDSEQVARADERYAAMQARRHRGPSLPTPPAS